MRSNDAILPITCPHCQHELARLTICSLYLDRDLCGTVVPVGRRIGQRAGAVRAAAQIRGSKARRTTRLGTGDSGAGHGQHGHPVRTAPIGCHCAATLHRRPPAYLDEHDFDSMKPGGVPGGTAAVLEVRSTAGRVEQGAGESRRSGFDESWPGRGGHWLPCYWPSLCRHVPRCTTSRRRNRQAAPSRCNCWRSMTCTATSNRRPDRPAGSTRSTLAASSTSQRT